jgi:transcription antitermination protein NusB
VSESIPGLGSRREAREEALALLYEAEQTGDRIADSLARRPILPADYAIELASGVETSVTELDSLISANLTGWTISRMPVVDRVIARIGAWELSQRPEIPTGVVLSEAVEIATQYCAEQSPRFLNGVLRSIADEVRDSE